MLESNVSLRLRSEFDVGVLVLIMKVLAVGTRASIHKEVIANLGCFPTSMLIHIVYKGAHWPL